MRKRNELQDKIARIPLDPGIYHFKDEKGRTLYIGKARSLRKRVQSYFSHSEKDPKTNELVRLISDIETIQTDNELEALILESNLVKKYKPPFNIILRDDKHYPFLRLSIRESYPRLKVVRKIKKDGSLYYGPYVPTRPMRNTLRLINKYFGLRQCSRKLVEVKKRPCLNHQMGRCLGPCASHDREEYAAAIEQVRLFLEGKQDRLTGVLEEKMRGAASELNFERAATIRDQIRDIERTLSKQNIISSKLEDLDVIGYVKEGAFVTVDLFHVRMGRILGRHSHRIVAQGQTSDADVLQDFITQYYLKETYLPKEILVPFQLPDAEVVAEWFSERRGSRVKISRPVRGRKREILDLTHKNARVSHMVRMQESKQIEKTMRALKEQLGLKRDPLRIEGFDISHTQGVIAVGSVVVWEHNSMNPSQYRRFRIKNVDGIDDFAMMAEIVKRRFERILNESGTLPGLLLIDGGLGHVNAVFSVLQDLGLADLDVVGIAKGRKLDETMRDRLYKPEQSDPIILDPDSQALHILQQVRDEAHRFAITFHQKMRRKRSLHSVLDDVYGVGKKRKSILLQHFRSLKRLKEASQDELLGVPGIDRKTALAIHRFFHAQAAPETGIHDS